MTADRSRDTAPAAAGDPDDEYGAPAEHGAFVADPDDPELNPDVERASEIDDVTGQVPVVDPSHPEGADTAAEGAGAAGSDSDEAVDGNGEPAVVPAADLEAMRTERDQYREMAQRIQAEFDNFRRRSGAQAAADADRAAGRLVEALLPVLDAAEAAYVEHPDEVGPLLNAMLGELRKHGLESLELEGKPFDPEVAEAVAHEPGDGGDVLVAAVLRSGYRWKDTTLRAAMVRTKD